ncbi:MAG: hypothetical protein ACK4WC_08950, partial [Rubrimonas sp.]
MRGSTVPGVVAALAILHLALVLPNHPAALRPETLLFLPLEAPAIVAILVLVGPAGAVSKAARAVLTVAILLISLLKLGDYGTAVAYSRPFTAAVDHHLIAAGWNLTRGSVGPATTALLAALTAVVLVLAALGLWGALGRLAALGPPRRGMRAPLA